MKNLKLYEDFATKDLPDFSEVLKGVSTFYAQDQDKISDPKRYVTSNRTYILNRAKNPEDKQQLFRKIIKHFKEEDYDYVSFPKTEGFDFDKAERALKSVNVAYEFGDGMNPAISLPVNKEGQKYFLLIAIENKETLFGLFQPNTSANLMLDYKGSGGNKSLKLLFYVNGEFHTGTFELDYVEPGNARFEEDPYAVYFSTQTSDGKEYEFSASIEPYEYRYNNGIDFTDYDYDLTEVTDKKTS